MPEMNGADFMKAALRLQPEATGLFMSGYSDDIVLQRGVDHSEIPLINKPFELQALALLIRERLDEKVAGKTCRADTLSEEDTGSTNARQNPR